MSRSSAFLFVAIACASCSRRPHLADDDATDSASTADAAPASVPVASAASSAGPAAPRHSFMLPKTRYDLFTLYSPTLGLAAGKQPSAEHPAGTVYVAEQIETFSAPFTITEWDLASGTPLRRAALPIEPKNTSPVMVNAGGLLHLVDWGLDHHPYYFELSPSLKVVTKTPVIGMAGDRPSALATDGALTVVVARRPRTEDPAIEYSTTFAATFDTATGKPIASRTIDLPGETPRSAHFRDNAVVVGGDAYVLHRADAGLRVLRLTANLIEVAQRVLTTRTDMVVTSVTLRVEGDHLVAHVPPESFEVPFDLSSATPIPSRVLFVDAVNGGWCDSETEVSMGPANAWLCKRSDGDSIAHILAWDRDQP